MLAIKASMGNFVTSHKIGVNLYRNVEYNLSLTNSGKIITGKIISEHMFVL